MAALPSFGTVNVGVLSNAIAVAIQQASVRRHSLGQLLTTSVNDSTTHQQASSGSSQAQGSLHQADQVQMEKNVARGKTRNKSTSSCSS